MPSGACTSSHWAAYLSNKAFNLICKGSIVCSPCEYNPELGLVSVEITDRQESRITAPRRIQGAPGVSTLAARPFLRQSSRRDAITDNGFDPGRYISWSHLIGTLLPARARQVVFGAV